jgi:hypothetical protein
MSALNEDERRFAAYLDEYGYSWKHEPNYQAELGLAGSLETKPDFLVERGGHRTVAEVRQFETTALQDYLANSGRAGVMSPSSCSDRFAPPFLRRPGSCVRWPAPTCLCWSCSPMR